MDSGLRVCVSIEISVSPHVSMNRQYTCMDDCSCELSSMLLHMCRHTASEVLYVPLLAHGCVIGPRPAMLMHVCVRASCCCKGRLPFVCVWPGEDYQMPRTSSAEWGREAWMSCRGNQNSKRRHKPVQFCGFFW